MDFSSINLFKIMKAKMAYQSERQDLLAQNIANIDTPGYKAKDLKKLNFEKLAMLEAGRLEMRATNAKHIPSGAGGSQLSSFKNELQRDMYEINPVDNTVSVEDQMKRISENSIAYQMTTNLYKKMADLFKVAISNR